MSYRLLALDLDGTLLRSDQRVDPDDVAAIAELQAAGVTVTIVTGRLHSGSTAAARACAIDGVIACCEGSHLIELASNETVHHHALDPELCELLRDAMEPTELAPFVFDAHGIHHDHAGAAYAGYVATWSPNLRVVEEGGRALAMLNAETEPLAAVAVGDPTEVAAVMARLAPHGGRLFSVSFPVSAYPGKHAVLVRAGGPTKGTALRELCRRIGCTPAEAVAVGDWVNDVPMFEVAGRSFAMGQAPEAVRAKATDQLDRAAGSGGGIAEAIRRAWG